MLAHDSGAEGCDPSAQPCSGVYCVNLAPDPRRIGPKNRYEGDSTLEGGDMTVWRTAASIGTLLVLAAGGVNHAAAEITRIEITSVESPTFGGREFGQVGAYEKLHGRAYGAIDPALPQNAVITDIDLAPRNADGLVEYSMDIFILKPIDLSRGNHRLFLDMNNRGEMRVGRLNDTALSNDPTTAADAGHGFVMDLGYTIVGNGWDFGASKADGRADDLGTGRAQPRRV